MSRRAPLAIASAPAGREVRVVLLWRGAVAAVVLAGYSAAGVVGAFLALAPALWRGPFGRPASPRPAAQDAAPPAREALPG